MTEQKISEMTIEELKLYQEQLNRKLAEVNYYLRKKVASNGNKWSKQNPYINYKGFVLYETIFLDF